MSKIKPEKAYAKYSVSSFGGIREGISTKTPGASSIRNFRLRSDGSLEKRSGWKHWKQLPATVRGFWEGTLNGEYYAFAVCGNKVYQIQDTEIIALNDTLITETGNVTFVRYRNRLYLMDHVIIRLFSPESQSFLPAKGYVPLYGHNWHPTQMGDINEPLNLLTPSIRIHYLNTTGSKTFSLPFFASSIDAVHVNNRATSSYSFTAGSDTLTLNSASAGDVVEIAMTISGSNDLRRQIHCSTDFYLDRNGVEEHLLLYGAPEGYRIFVSSEVSDISLTYCSLFYSDCDPLYFQKSKLLLIGDEDHPVTAITGNFDRLLAFTTNKTYSVGIDGDKLYFYPLLSDFGCRAKNAAVQIGNDTVVLNEQGVCRLHSTASDPDALSAVNLSEEIGTSLIRSLSEHTFLFWDSAKQELWVRDMAEATEGIVWIWSARTEEWYCFDGVYASLLFSHGGQVLFANQNRLCLFDDTVTTDGGASFSAYYQSNYLSFDAPHASKRALRATVCASTGGSELQISVSTERKIQSIVFQGRVSRAPEVFDLRLAPGRFRFLSYRIACTGATPSKIYEAKFFTNL